MRKVKATLFTQFKGKLRSYWQLIKSLQTALLLITGLAGYLSAKCPVRDIPLLLSVSGSLFLAISGSTVLNMWYDRDIDRKMDRTCYRPLASGKISEREALLLGSLLSLMGIGWALSANWMFGVVVFAGWFFDVIIYTVWLKRRTSWSIVWGGISGAMPILAGRVLAVGTVDWVGIVLALGVLFWIPTHIMTFNIKYFEDYQKAGVPTFPARYGFQFTRQAIAVSSILAALMMAAAGFGIGMLWGYMRLLAVLSIGLLLLAGASVVRPSETVNFGLFKYASIYMLGAMILMII
jgi:protoheme IX farnesyltransferase